MKTLDPLSYAQQIALRASIIGAERKMMKARYRRSPLSSGDKRTTLSIKALHLGCRYHDVPNPFEGWKHEMASELAESFRQGQGT